MKAKEDQSDLKIKKKKEKQKSPCETLVVKEGTPWHLRGGE